MSLKTTVTALTLLSMLAASAAGAETRQQKFERLYKDCLNGDVLLPIPASDCLLWAEKQVNGDKIVPKIKGPTSLRVSS